MALSSNTLRFLVAATCLVSAATSYAQDAASAGDKAFVAKVSQGGQYEVEASEVAVHRALAQDVKDLAYSEVHDHGLVGKKLKAISAAKGVPIAAALNVEFQGKLDHLKALSGAEFDASYLEEMKAIHDKDEKLFAAEAQDGGATEYKSFAAETDKIVKRHIGALHSTD